MKHTFLEDIEFEGTNLNCESGSESDPDLPPCCKLEAQKRPRKSPIPSLIFTPPSPAGSISIFQHDGPNSRPRSGRSQISEFHSGSFSDIHSEDESEPIEPSECTKPIKSTRTTGKGIRIRKYGRRVKPCRPGKPCRPRCKRCKRPGYTTRGRGCKPGKRCEGGIRPCPHCEPWSYRVKREMKNVPPPSSQPDQYPLGYPRFPLLITMRSQSIHEARSGRRMLYTFSIQRRKKPDIVLNSGPSRDYPPLAIWNPCYVDLLGSPCYEGVIEVFKSGSDSIPTQKVHFALPGWRGQSLPKFSWCFPDGRSETFEWRRSGRQEVRDVSEKRHGKGLKCVRHLTGKIVAARMPLETGVVSTRHNGRMAFFRWNMSKDMGDDFEVLLVMSLIVSVELSMRRSRSE
jgi:hypothetical protein